MVKSDIPFFLNIRNECCGFLHTDTQYTLEQSIDWFEANDPKFYIIYFDDTRIGYFRTSFWDVENKFMSLGADLHKDFRGKGYAKKAYKAFMESANKTTGIDCFFLEVLSHNEVAMKLYESLGFVIFGKRPHDLRNGKLVDSISMVYRMETK